MSLTQWSEEPVFVRAEIVNKPGHLPGKVGQRHHGGVEGGAHDVGVPAALASHSAPNTLLPLVS
jgi:hypothetical protein